MAQTQQTLLLTGAAGFIGSHLAAHLVQAGYKVRALLRYSSQAYEGNLRWLPPTIKEEIEIVRGDIKDPAFCLRAVEGCEVVMHLAALIGIPFSYHNPVDYVQTNVLGTTHLLEAARRSGVKRFVQTSTSEVYGTAQTIPITEMHPLHPQSPYAASKVASDALALSYERSFGLPVTVIRPFNTFGPWQSPRAIIPVIIQQLLKGNTLHLGNVKPVRDFLYVSDTVKGFLDVGLHANTIGKTIQLVSQAPVSIGDLVGKIADAIGTDADIQLDPQRIRPDASEVMHLEGSYAFAEQLTGWKPQHTLVQGLSETIQWFQKHEGDWEVGGYRL